VGAGGFITGYSFDDTGRTRVARADVYGAYIWLEDRQRWAQLVKASTMPADTRGQDVVSTGVYEIVVAPSNADRIYMALKDKIYRSDDRGRSFMDLKGPKGNPADLNGYEFNKYGPFLAVAPHDPDLVLFGTATNGLWRSANGGERWSRVETVPVGRDLRDAPGLQTPGAIVAFDRTRSSRVWVVSGGNGVFLSDDEGKTFAPAPNHAAAAPATLRQLSIASDGTIFGVDSESQSAWRYRYGAWAKLDGLPPSRFAAVAAQPNSPIVWVFTEGGRPYRSRDGGNTWIRLLHGAEISKGDPRYLEANDVGYWAMSRVAFDPVDFNRLWVAAGTGVYYADVASTLFKITWQSRLQGIEELVATDAIKPPGRSLLLGGWDFGIHRKEDLQAYSSTFGPKRRVLISAQQLAWTPADPDFVVTNASDARTSCCAEDGDAVLAGYSTDAGKHWTKFKSLPHPPGTEATDPWRMSFGSIAISARDPDNIAWLPTYDRSPYVTKDRGVTWSRVVLAGEKLPFTGSHAAMHLPRKTLAADRVLAGTFYLMHSGGGHNPDLEGLWKTVDGGTVWTRVFKGALAPHAEQAAKLRSVPGRAGHLFFTAGTLGPFDTRLRRSTTGGERWEALDEVDQVDDVAFGKPVPGGAYPTLFISGRVGGIYGIWRSTDTGRTWRRLTDFAMGSLDRVNVIEGDPDVFGRVYVGFGGSGWVYGEPSLCTPTAPTLGADAECTSVQ
jgi:photosystem II stability/assembly factor-like uncharacterized protein